MKTYEQFQRAALFTTVMSQENIDGWSNYIGPELNGWLCGPKRSRDSDLLQESNFVAALERLGGEGGNVQVYKFSHWACGWFEQVMVKIDSEESLKLYQIYKDLERFPVLDESDFQEREFEYRSEYAEQAKDELAAAIEIHFGIKATKALKEICYQLNMECQSFYGTDSCVNIYDCRKPDRTDLEQVKTCMDQMGYDYKHSPLFKRLYKAVTKAIESIKESA